MAYVQPHPHPAASEDAVADCLFCKIVRRELPSTLRYEDDVILAFDDIHPQAPVHVLLIPKRHIRSLNDLTETDAGVLEHLISQARALAHTLGVGQSGYRVVLNTGEDSGWGVQHLHLHLLGGKFLGHALVTS